MVVEVKEDETAFVDGEQIFRSWRTLHAEMTEAGVSATVRGQEEGHKSPDVEYDGTPPPLTWHFAILSPPDTSGIKFGIYGKANLLRQHVAVYGPADQRRVFEEIEISIRASEELNRGSLYFTKADASLRRFKDTLNAELFLPTTQLAAIVDEIRRFGPDARILVSFNALLFDWQYSDRANILPLRSDKIDSVPAVLSAVSVSEPLRPAPTAKVVTPSLPPEPPVQSDPAISEGVGLLRKIVALAVPLWAIAGAIIVAAIFK